MHRTLTILCVSFCTGVLWVLALGASRGILATGMCVAGGLLFVWLRARVARADLRYTWRAGLSLTAMVILSAFSGCAYGVHSMQVEQRVTARLLALSTRETGAVMTLVVLDGAVTETATRISSACNVVGSMGPYGMQHYRSPSPAWCTVAIGGRKSTTATMRSTTVTRYYPLATQFHTGELIAIYLRFHAVPKGAFATSLARRGIHVLATGSIYGAHILSVYANLDDGFVVSGWLVHVVEARLVEAFGSSVAPWLEGITIGDRSGLSKSVVQSFVALGIIHVLIASGATIRMTIRPFVGWIERRVPRSWPVGLVVGLAGLSVLLLLTEFAAPSVRAAVVYAYDLLAAAQRKSPDRLTKNAIACVVLLAVEPHLLMDPGVILSFAAAVALGTLPQRIEQLLLYRVRRRWLRHMLSRGLSAELSISPLVAAEFGQFSWISILVNAVLYPVLEWLLPCAFLLVAAGVAVPAGVQFARPFLTASTRAVDGWILWAAKYPVMVHFPVPPFWALCVYSVVLLLCLYGVPRYTSRVVRKYLQ